MTGPKPGARAACRPWPTSPTRPCGSRATRRPANRREAGGAPAIGIEARKGRDPAPPGLGAKHESPGPEGASPPPRKGTGEAVRWSRPGQRAGTDADRIQRIESTAVRPPLHAFEVVPVDRDDCRARGAELDDRAASITTAVVAFCTGAGRRGRADARPQGDRAAPRGDLPLRPRFLRYARA